MHVSYRSHLQVAFSGAGRTEACTRYSKRRRRGLLTLLSLTLIPLGRTSDPSPPSLLSPCSFHHISADMPIRAGHGQHGYQVGGRDSIGAFLHPTNGYRGALAKSGVRPKDHARANFDALRSKQADNRARKEAEAAAVSTKKEGGFKLARFSNVQSRVMQAAASPPKHAPPGQPGKENERAFLRKGAGRKASAGPSSPRANMGRGQPAAKVWKAGEAYKTQYTPASQQNLGARNTKPRVPRRAELAAAQEQQQPAAPHKDFISENNALARNAKAKCSPTKHKGVAAPAERHKHGAYGKVPAYLASRKQQWAEQEEQRRIEAGDPDCPRGMKLMPESERMETLGALRKSQREGAAQLQKLPLHVETQSQMKRKAELEGKMKEIEEAIAIFSRTKVFISDS